MLPASYEKDETKKHQMQCRGEGLTGTIRMYVAGIDNNDDLVDLFIDLHRPRRSVPGSPEPLRVADGHEQQVKMQCRRFVFSLLKRMCADKWAADLVYLKCRVE